MNRAIATILEKMQESRHRMEKKTKFETHSCEFKNEEECEDELSEDAVEFEKEEADEYGEDI